MTIQNSRIYTIRIFVGALFAIILASGSAWEGRTDLIGTALFFIGTIFVGFGSLGRSWCSTYISGYKTDRLIFEGPYSICRNPLYFFSFLGSIGLGLVTETITIPLIIIIAFAIYYPWVIKCEEKELAATHKEEFEEYLSRVSSFLPRLSNLKEPDTYSIRPVPFRRHMFDNLWFIWLIGIIQLINRLHESSILPRMCEFY